MKTPQDPEAAETVQTTEIPAVAPAATCCASLASRLEKLKRIGRAKGKGVFESDLNTNDTRPFFCPGFPLILHEMKAAGYEMGDCEETVQAAFEFATAFRDEYSRLYFRHFAP